MVGKYYYKYSCITINIVICLRHANKIIDESGGANHAVPLGNGEGILERYC
jgi:hypothetical protein